MEHDNRGSAASTIDDSSGTKYVWYVAGIGLLLLVLALIVSALDDAARNSVAVVDDETRQQTTSQLYSDTSAQQGMQGQEPPQTFGTGGGDVAIGDMLNDPETFEGNTVIITGGVDQILGDNAFVVDEGTLMNEITVFHSYQTLVGGSMPLDLSDDVEVEVQGVVWMFNRNDIQYRLGITFPDQMFAEWDMDEPVLIAESVRVIE